MDKISASGFIILLFLQGLQAQTTFVITPENKAVMIGDYAEFHCEIQQSPVLTDYISWDECITPTSDTCRRISNDGAIVYSALGGDADREARYSISNTQTGQYNLKISGVKPDDGGKYRCLARQTASVTSFALLIILDKIDCIQSGTSFEENSTVTLSCQVRYYGQRLIPELRWIKNGQPVTATTITNSSTEVISVLTFKAAPKNNDDVFHVTVTVGESFASEPNEATNIPYYEDYYTFDALDILYSPKNLTIYPSEKVYNPGDEIECMAKAKPAPKFQWINPNISLEKYNGSKLTITENMLGEHVYICRAYNIYGTTDSKPLQIMVAAKQFDKVPGQPIFGYCIFGGLLAISLVGNIIAILCWKGIIHVKSKTNRHEPIIEVSGSNQAMPMESRPDSYECVPPAVYADINPMADESQHGAKSNPDAYESVQRAVPPPPAVYAQIGGSQHGQ